MSVRWNLHHQKFITLAWTRCARWEEHWNLDMNRLSKYRLFSSTTWTWNYESHYQCMLQLRRHKATIDDRWSIMSGHLIVETAALRCEIDAMKLRPRKHQAIFMTLMECKHCSAINEIRTHIVILPIIINSPFIDLTTPYYPSSLALRLHSHSLSEIHWHKTYRSWKG